MITLFAAISFVLSLCATTTHRPPSASNQCQVWADGVWVAEVGVKEHEMRNRGCQFDGYQDGFEVWTRDRSSCGVSAFRLARLGTVGPNLIAAMTERGRCEQGADGGWYPVERRR